MFVVDICYKVPLAEVEPFFEAHIAFVRKYVDLGVFMLTAKKIPRSGGIILANAPSETELIEILQEDPFWEFGLAVFHMQEVQLSQVSAKLTEL